MNYNEVNVRVSCQYYENYNVGPDGFGETPYWKPKGGFEFIFPIDSDVMMYAPEEHLLTAIKSLVAKQNTMAERFEYISHEVEFNEPYVVEGLITELEQVLDQVYN